MNDDQWLCLLCSPAKTTVLLDKLREKQLTAWTPMWTRSQRKPRGNATQKVSTPALPGFIFMPARDMYNANRLRLALACPGFTFMNINGCIVRFEEKELEPLRKISDPEPEQVFGLPEVGTEVMINSGSFQGLKGRVTANAKRESWVRFVGFNADVKIPPFLFSVVER